MLYLNIFKLLSKFDEVEADTSLNLTSINEHKELWFYTCVEVPFEFWSGVTVNSNMMEV